MAGELHGRVALVTGAATGIGRATALRLADAGAHVLVHCARSREDAGIVAGLIEERGRKAHVLQADLRDRAGVARLAQEAEAHWGHVDILVNNAATVEEAIDARTAGPDLLRHLPRWDEVLDVNLRAPYELTARLAPGMMQRGHGVVVNVASVAGLYALTDAPLYSLSKAGLLHLTRQAALMFAPKVRVNAVAPGWIETDFGGGFIRDPEFQKQLKRHIPLDRLGDVEEVAAAILFLVKDAAYTTGTVVRLDGGLTAELR